MRMTTDIERSICMPGQDCAYLVRIFNVEEWVERVIVQVALRVAVQHGIPQGAVGEDDSDAFRVFNQGSVQKSQRFLGKDHMYILSQRVGLVGVRLIEHNAHDLASFPCCPCITHRYIPGRAELCGGMNRIFSTFSVKFVIADTGKEWNIAQLCRDVLCSQGIILRCSCIDNIARRNAESWRTLV